MVNMYSVDGLKLPKKNIEGFLEVYVEICKKTRRTNLHIKL